MEANLYSQVLDLIRGTGQFVDDISARYFQGIHRYMPFISRRRFESGLTTLGATPSAGYSVLLLSLCLITSSPKLGWGTGCSRPAKDSRLVYGRSLHLATKSLFAQVQGCYPPSVPLIQAGLLLAMYEYAHGQPDDAFVSIAVCARMGYAARLHLCKQASTDKDNNSDSVLGSEEAANTWWGLIICERAFICEVTVPEQPLVTAITSGDAKLPTEPALLEQNDLISFDSIPCIPVSYLSSPDVGSFGRTAQAAWLLDKILKVFQDQSFASRLIQLQALDGTLQKFLGALFEQSNGKRGILCEVIGITIKAIFTLHWHILSQPPLAISESGQFIEEWCQRSHVALDAATKMVLDVVEVHENPDSCSALCVAPSYPYINQAALRHIHGKSAWEEEGWLQDAETRLRRSLSLTDTIS
ncbi:hypothetical protein B0J13DRAFT_626759 [Dactylonectria estremocensis]|uniref:Xylanolytic transcriptional activator regulatory domain-containing protein n=1 Tax=Dactylonectria estremocensis TaxID=1079267 RepID=A0A9P9E6Y6_9HYPO|nr:hypothetical protein B0J13DRAFT_626759 [Dactylonectria estremocensis]